MAGGGSALRDLIDGLSGDTVPRPVRAGSFLFLAGDAPERVYLLHRGAVKLVARDPEGTETIVGLAFAGETIGEAAALGNFPQPADAIATADCIVTGVPASVLMEALFRDPVALGGLGAVVAERLRWTLEVTTERASGEVPSRLAGRLLDLGTRIGAPRTTVLECPAVDLELPLDQADLGKLAGMSRESACKTMRSFRRDGLLDYRGRRVRILRPDLLERIRCGARYEGGRAKLAGEPSR